MFLEVLLKTLHAVLAYEAVVKNTLSAVVFCFLIMLYITQIADKFFLEREQTSDPPNNLFKNFKCEIILFKNSIFTITCYLRLNSFYA